MSLTRTSVQNDSGSGTDGTIATNEWLQEVWNTIDGRWSEKLITLTGTQHNLSLAVGNTEADVVYLHNASDLTITGIAAPVSPAKPGKRLVLISSGLGNVFLAHNSGSSAPTARLLNAAASGLTPLAAGYGKAVYAYDATISALWRLVHHEQGAWLTPAFAAGNYFVSAGAWTVGSGDVVTQAWKLSGRTMMVRWYLTTTTVSGTPTSLLIGNGAWGGFTAAKRMIQPGIGDNAGAGNEVAFAQVAGSGTSIDISQMDGGVWSNATNTTGVYGGLDFEVT